MWDTLHRTIRDNEAAVVRAALERSGTEIANARLLESIASRSVIGGCACGCASVRFEVTSVTARPRPIVEMMGATPAGGTVGVTVWEVDEQVAGLEIYDLGAGAGNLVLPVPETLERLPKRPVVYLPTRTILSILAIVYGAGSIAIAWIGSWATDAYWPGAWRYYTATGVGGAAFLWGLSVARRRSPHRRVAVAVRPIQALWVVLTIVLGTIASLAFFGW